MQQLLNYKNATATFQQAAFILNSSSDQEIEKMIRDVLSLTTDEFVVQTLSWLCNPGDPTYGMDLNNIAVILSSVPYIHVSALRYHVC